MTQNNSVYDTHCHYEGYWSKEVFAQLLANARKIGFLDSVTCPHNASRFKEHITFCRRFGLSIALGIHPFEWQDKSSYLQTLETFLPEWGSSLVAIGEIGLDFSEVRHRAFWPNVDRQTVQKQQIELFETQLEIARDLCLPVSVHAFGALNEVERCIKKFRGIQGVIHAFNGSIEQAQQFNKLGFKLGFGGTLTYPGSKKIRRVFSELPNNAWVLETDAPWIPSQERRKTSVGIDYGLIQSEPADINFTIQSAAKIRQVPHETICSIAYENTREVFFRLQSK